MSVRTVDRIISGTRQVDGAGVRLVRVIGYRDVKELDPFLMLDSFDSTNPEDYIKGFPWHPHRGIETVTYLIKGKIEHGDSIGNQGNILGGCCQWMTAGGGILHQEMPKPCERMLGVQLWLNLPKKDKMVEPQYHDLTADRIPCLEDNGCTIKVISGRYKDVTGPMLGDYVKMQFYDVELKPGSKWKLSTDPNETLFIYILEGEGYFAENKEDIISNHQGVLFDSGDDFIVESSISGLHFLLFAGKPLKEPIAWGGPIVMNTQEELEQAFREIEEGTFIK